MEQTCVKLTVLFEDPFWVGVFERTEGGRYAACKVTFGAEPKDYEVYDLFLRGWSRLRFSPSVRAEGVSDTPNNPKRMQREIRRRVQDTGMGTKAQQALKAQQQEGKDKRRIRARARREAESEQRYALRTAKRKEKHRGH